MSGYVHVKGFEALPVINDFIGKMIFNYVIGCLKIFYCR